MTAAVLNAGAAKSVSAQTLSQLITLLRTAAQATNANTYDAHNHYATYVLVVLLLSTGLRPVHDVAESIDLLDEVRGFVVGCDKVVRHPLESRLVPLGETCVVLLRQYLDHLRRLADALQDREGDFADSLRAITTRGLAKLFPLFFLFGADGRVENITPSLLTERVPMLKQLEANIGRSWIASLGCAPGLDADLIRAALGHHEIGQSVFGPNSPRCPSELEALGKYLDQRLVAMGARPLESPLLPARTPTLRPIIGQRHEILGIAKRAQAQRDQASAAKALHRRSLFECVAQARRGRMTQSDIDVVFRSICGASGLPQTRVQVEAHTRAHDVLGWLLTRRGLTLSLPPRYRPLTAALLSSHSAAHFEPATLALARECEALGRALDQWLATRAGAARSSPAHGDPNRLVTYAMRVAEATVSLALHSRVADPLLLANVADRAYDLVGIPGLASFAVFGVAVRGSAVPMLRRVVLHPVTLALLGSLKARDDVAPPHRIGEQLSRLVRHIHQASARHNVVSYLSELVDAGASSPGAVGGLRHWLCRRVGALNAVTLPGVVVSYLDGTARAVGLRAGAFARVVTGLPLAGQPSTEQHDDPRAEHAAANIGAVNKDRPFLIDPPGRAGDRKAIREELARFNALLRAVNRVLRDYSRLGGRRARSGPREKDRLIAKLQIELRRHGEAPVEAQMPVQFLIWMLSWFRGRAEGAPLHHISTSLRYYYAVTPRIPLAMLQARCHGQEADVLADVYGAALDSVAPRGQAYVFQRLQLFHVAMQVDYGLPDIDWADVAPLTLVGSCAVDAGVITYDEYHVALDLLVSDPGADERMRKLQAWVLLVTYRFGLRISEALGLRRKDIWRNDTLPILLIRPNAYRELKSDAGQRVIPLVGTFSELERKVFFAWISHVDELFATDDETTMAATRDVGRLMVQTEALRRRVREALQAATGDENVRLHHLRHAYAMRLQIVMTLQQMPVAGPLAEAFARVLGPTDLEGSRQLLLDTDHLSHRGLTAARMLVGHSSIEVFRRCYAHLDDLLSMTYLRPVFEVQSAADDQVVSYCVGRPIDRISRSRLKAMLADDFVVDLLGGHVRGLESLVLDRTHAPALPVVEATPQPELRLVDIDRVLDIVHRRRGVDGLPVLTMWPVDLLAKLLEAEHRVREAARYDIASSGWPETSATTSVSHVRAGQRMLHETRRVTMLLHDVQRLLEKDELVSSSRVVCEIWSRCYRPDATPWVLPGLDELKAVVTWCLSLGAKPDQLQVRVPADAAVLMADRRWHEKLLASIPRVACESKALPAARRASDTATRRSRERIGLIVVENDNGPVVRMTHLNRAMHVLSRGLARR
jgi:site-specific recombinase XerD